MSAKPSTKPSARGFDRELGELEALGLSYKANAALDADQVEYLRKSLAHRNNFLVAKAAKLVVEADLAALLPEVLVAYDRFFLDAAKSDPQCWAKNALVKALVKLEHRQRDAYLRGVRHHQMEPVWGGPTDTAGALRGACTHALVNCPGLSDAELLTVLLEPLVDADKTVRMEAARAIAQVGGVAGALLLRLRILLGLKDPKQEEPEVLGVCLSGLLALEGAEAIALAATAMKEGDDLASEAAFALADLRTVEALTALRQRYRAGVDAWFGSVLLGAMALTRLPEAIDFLIEMIESEARDAALAVEALGRSAPTAELRARVEQAARYTGSPKLAAALREHFGPQAE